LVAVAVAVSVATGCILVSCFLFLQQIISIFFINE